MMSTKRARDQLRVPATVVSAFAGLDRDHELWTVSVVLEGAGWVQTFGGLAFRDKAETREFFAEVCATFGCADPERLKGQRCFALYAEPSSTIEGIETTNGRRFTIRGWRKRRHPDHAPTPTEEKRIRLERDVRYHERRLIEARAELATIQPLVDWEEEP
jgi:hypothetical protein